MTHIIYNTKNNTQDLNFVIIGLDMLCTFFVGIDHNIHFVLAWAYCEDCNQLIVYQSEVDTYSVSSRIGGKFNINETFLKISQ